MLYLIALILAIPAGILAKGKLSNLLEFRFEKTGLIISAFVLQLLGRILALRGVSFIIEYSLVFQGVVFGMLLVGFWFNRKYLGIWVVGAGCALNALVMMVNGGKMPVSGELVRAQNLTSMLKLLETGADGRHSIITAGTRLPFLADIIHPPYFLGYWMDIVSIGDLVVMLGVFILVFCAVTKKKLRMGALGLKTGGFDNEKVY